jgi:hypothetical protein
MNTVNIMGLEIQSVANSMPDYRYYFKSLGSSIIKML